MKKEEKYLRSGAAEYLTFVSSYGNINQNIEIRYENENIWLTQKLMAELYNVEIATINEHINRIINDNELEGNSTIRKFLIVQNEGSRVVKREVKHYSLQMIISVGFKVNNERAVQFRKWANKIVKDFTIQGWAMDDERLKNFGTIINEDYFEKQLEKIREIRLSERRFYQKITDIYATSLDYDYNSTSTKRFFATVQNKLHWAIHGNTAAEIILNRADSNKENMGLTNWDGSPEEKIHKYDVIIAKNYLSDDELKQLERIVTAYIEMAELQAKNKIPMTMKDWETRLNKFLDLVDKDILKDSGKVSAELAHKHAECEFEKYRLKQDLLYNSDFDKFLELENNKK